MLRVPDGLGLPNRVILALSLHPLHSIYTPYIVLCLFPTSCHNITVSVISRVHNCLRAILLQAPGSVLFLRILPSPLQMHPAGTKHTKHTKHTKPHTRCKLHARSSHSPSHHMFVCRANHRQKNKSRFTNGVSFFFFFFWP